MPSPSGPVLEFRLVRRHQRRRRPVILHTRVSQYVAPGRPGTEFRVAEYELIFALVQFGNRFRGCRRDIHGIPASLEYGLKSQPRRKVAVYQQYAGQV